MGLLQNLKNAAIRNAVQQALRQGCPEGLEQALERLLADQNAVNAIQNLVSANYKTPAGITSAAILALPFAPEIKGLLAGNSQLVDYLVSTAVSKLSR